MDSIASIIRRNERDPDMYYRQTVTDWRASARASGLAHYSEQAQYVRARAWRLAVNVANSGGTDADIARVVRAYGPWT